MDSTSACCLTRVEMVMMRAMPAPCARATTASSSSAKSGKSRWQWLSISIWSSVPHVGSGRARIFFLEPRDLLGQVFQDAPASFRIGAICHLGHDLAERRDDLVHIDGIFFAARRAVL